MGNQGLQQSQETPKEFTALDTRKSANHPLRHAVINAIRKIADFHASASTLSNGKDESDVPKSRGESPADGLVPPQKGSNYLLTSLTMFVTHEPCVMCSMALLHSRVKEVIYLRSMPLTGACGSIACLPTLKGVNHRYSIAQWKQDRNQRNSIDTTTGQGNATHTVGMENAKVDSLLDIEITMDA